MKENKRNIAIFLLLITTILWGTTFIITRTLIQDIPIFLYMGLRNLIGLIGFAPLLITFKKINKQILSFGIFAGVIYFLAMFFQTWGLQTTTAGKAGFVTGLSTIMVPFMAYLIYKKDLDKKIWIAVSFSVVGMALLLLEGESGIIIGDWLVLICAFSFAYFIVINDKYVRLVDVYLYSMVQMATVTGLSYLFSFLLGETYDLFSIEPNLTFWLIMIYLGIAVTTATFLFQNWSQQHVEPSITAIIFTLEPVFAMLFGILLGNETMSLLGWFGCGIIFIAIIFTVLKVNTEEHEIINPEVD